MDTHTPDPVALRQRLRRIRRAIDPDEQRRASLAVNARVLQLPAFRRAHRLAGYVGSKGEIDPMPLLHLAHLSGKQCFLPVLHPFLPGRLWFVPWTPATPMQHNCYDIPEPLFTPEQRCKPQWLDLVLMPLLGFDGQCNRLGMGGGFYDRTFAFLRHRGRERRPRLAGLAHDAQRVEHMPTAPWDVRPSLIVTPSACLDCET